MPQGEAAARDSVQCGLNREWNKVEVDARRYGCALTLHTLHGTAHCSVWDSGLVG